MGRLNGCLIYDRREAEDREAAVRIADWRAIHGALPLPEQREQAARCMDCGVPFCHGGRILNGMASGCPLGNLIPEFNDLLYRGLDKAALGRLSLTNPLPEMTGRVCPAPCEAACLCGFNQEPITIRANECCLADLGFEQGWLTPIVNAGERGNVAVVGSGPAGLACAIRLRQLGFSVTVFERDDKPGGLLMYGIPNMKLEKSILDRRVAWMEESGIVFRLNTEVTDICSLSGEFTAVALCCGAREPRDLNVEGRGLDGIAFAVDYLTQATKAVMGGTDGTSGTIPQLNASGKDVIILGGGDTGNDCVATALRQGCKSVTQLEILPEPPASRQSTNPWPEWPRVLKVDYGQQESIARQGRDPRVYEAATASFRGKNGAVTGLTAKVKGETREFPAQLVLLAMGFLGPERRLAQSFGLEIDGRGRLLSQGYQTNLPNVYTAGDMRRGQSLVVWAIREGVEVAESISAASHISD
ncbi:glutamate synthase subunit beta [Clostridia bacterium]|nr:glutamate synthase subunit beta [Clostridia bacterium]